MKTKRNNNNIVILGSEFIYIIINTFPIKPRFFAVNFDKNNKNSITVFTTNDFTVDVTWNHPVLRTEFYSYLFKIMTIFQQKFLETLFR